MAGVKEKLRKAAEVTRAGGSMALDGVALMGTLYSALTGNAWDFLKFAYIPRMGAMAIDSKEAKREGRDKLRKGVSLGLVGLGSLAAVGSALLGLPAPVGAVSSLMLGAMQFKMYMAGSGEGGSLLTNPLLAVPAAGLALGVLGGFWLTKKTFSKVNEWLFGLTFEKDEKTGKLKHKVGKSKLDEHIGGFVEQFA